MISISMQTFIIGSFILYLIIYLTCIKSSFNKVGYYFMNVITLIMTSSYGIYFHNNNFEWLIVNDKSTYYPVLVFGIALGYIYIFAWVLPQKKTW